MAIKCPKCNTDNPDRVKFCGECGTLLRSVQGTDPTNAGPDSYPIDVGPDPRSGRPSGDIPDLTKTMEAPREELIRGFTFASRYEIIEELGRGGMGRVYRVEDSKLKQEVALKLIKPEIAKDKKTIERFRNELKTARMISHKNVCRMFDIGEEKGVYFITMEYVPGEDLKSFIRRSGQMAVGTTLRIAKQVCEGLTEAHKLGVVHRDLKPQNVMIDTHGNARIMDFGIARSLEAKGITGAGVMIGTPEYMSPEQVEWKEVDQRTDIYSLGIILFEMLTGQVPFRGDTALSIAVQHKTESPSDPKTFNPQIPENLSRIVLKCLEKDKASRYQNIERLYSGLIEIEEGMPSTVKGPTPKEFKTPTTFKERWKNSIAVLPFTNMSADPEQEYFCDGIAEELINALTQIKDLRVVARTSAFSFKGKDTDIEEIGKKLKVDKVLEGSVRKAGNRLRITAQLINVEDGYHLWSERYDRDLEDVFAIQDEVTLAIVDRMKVKLLGKEKQKLTKRPTDNPEAYQLYLKGRYFWEKRTSEGYKKANEFFNKAIEIDPEFALSYAGLASIYTSLGVFGLGRPKEVFPKAKSLNEKALEIDSSLAFAYRIKASVSLFYDWDWPSSERSFRKAINLNPGDATFYWIYALYLGWMGRFDEAIKEMKKAVNLDPLSLVINCDMGHIYYCARRYDESMKWYRKTLEIEPNYGMAFYHMGFTYAVEKNYKKSEESFKKANRLTGGLPWSVGLLSYVYSKLGKREKAESLLQELHNRSKKEYIHASCFTMAYSEIEGLDKAFEYWNDAYQEREPTCCMLKVLPHLDLFRSDPRFDGLLEKLNLK
jgi:serine/threonine protein kinase/tetratricopeptide (TPR) repeat protein